MPVPYRFWTRVFLHLGTVLGMFVCAGTLAASEPGGALVVAYVGPGAGLGMIGSLLAVLAALLIGVIGLVLYPITLIRKMLRKSKTDQPAQSSGSTS